jgi:hypothetical protein
VAESPASPPPDEEEGDSSDRSISTKSTLSDSARERQRQKRRADGAAEGRASVRARAASRRAMDAGAGRSNDFDGRWWKSREGPREGKSKAGEAKRVKLKKKKNTRTSEVAVHPLLFLLPCKLHRGRSPCLPLACGSQSNRRRPQAFVGPSGGHRCVLRRGIAPAPTRYADSYSSIPAKPRTRTLTWAIWLIVSGSDQIAYACTLASFFFFCKNYWVVHQCPLLGPPLSRPLASCVPFKNLL